MSVHDVDRPVDIAALAEMFAGPGPYPWTAARDVRLACAELTRARARAADVDDAKRIWADETLRKVPRLSDGTEYEVGTLVVMTDEERHKRHGIGHTYNDRVHVITSTLGRCSYAVECGPQQFGLLYLKRAPEGAEVTCPYCAGWAEQMQKSRADAEVFRKTQEIAAERDVAKQATRDAWAAQHHALDIAQARAREIERSASEREWIHAVLDESEAPKGELRARVSIVLAERDTARVERGQAYDLIEELRGLMASQRTEIAELRLRIPDCATEAARAKVEQEHAAFREERDAIVNALRSIGDEETVHHAKVYRDGKPTVYLMHYVDELAKESDRG